MSDKPVLEVKIHGPFQLGWSDGRSVELSSMKGRAMIGMLSTLPGFVATRDWLQTHLWPHSFQDRGRQSLRQELRTIKVRLGERFDDVFVVDNERIGLRADRIRVTGAPQEGAFLDGLRVRESPYIAWRDEHAERLSSAGVESAAQPEISVDGQPAVRPRLCVLPFTEIATPPSSGHLGDLIANEVLRAASRSTQLDVISHLSSRKIDPGRIDMASLRAQLPVDYAIHGHVRVTGDRVRLDADLVEVESERVLWSRQMVGRLGAILSGEDELAREMALLAGQAVLRHSIELAHSKPLSELQNHALFMSSIERMHSYKLQPFSTARQMLELLIERAPRVSMLRAWMAKWYTLAMTQGFSSDPMHDQRIAADHAARALDIDPYCETSLAIDGMIQGDMGHLDVAKLRHDEATRVNPSNAFGWLMHSRTSSFQNEGPQAVLLAERASALSPLDPQRYYYEILMAMALTVNEQYDRALQMAQRAIVSNPYHVSSYRTLCCAQVRTGDMEAARRTLLRLRRMAPELTVSRYLRSHPAAQSPCIQAAAADLRAAGLPE